MRIKMVSTFAGLLVASMGFAPATGFAAPQILALLPTSQPVPLDCSDGTCVAEIASMCLQEHRSSPTSQHVYRAGQGTKLTLSVTDADGVTRTMPVADKVSLQPVRGFIAVSISLSEGDVRKLGDGVAKISVAPLASAIPLPLAGDKTPLTQDEIDRTTGALRQIARRTVRADGDRLGLAQALDLAVNELPYYQPATAAHVRRLIDTVNSRHQGNAAAQAVRRLNQCQGQVIDGVSVDLRHCLQIYKDGAVSDLTHKVWKAVTPGS